MQYVIHCAHSNFIIDPFPAYETITPKKQCLLALLWSDLVFICQLMFSLPVWIYSKQSEILNGSEHSYCYSEHWWNRMVWGQILPIVSTMADTHQTLPCNTLQLPRSKSVAEEQPTAAVSESSPGQQDACVGHTLCFSWARLIDVYYTDVSAVNAWLGLASHNETILKWGSKFNIYRWKNDWIN
jgi:hypothetical protein